MIVERKTLFLKSNSLNIKMELFKALFLSLLMLCSGLQKTSDWNISETSQMLPDMVNTTQTVSDLVNTSELRTIDTSLTIPEVVNTTLTLSDFMNTSEMSSPEKVNGAELSSRDNIAIMSTLVTKHHWDKRQALNVKLMTSVWM